MSCYSPMVILDPRYSWPNRTRRRLPLLRDRGGIPAASVWVKPYGAMVLPGDTIGTVARRLCGDANRFPELMAANLGMLGVTPAEGEQDAALPTKLEPGLALFIPATWPDLSPIGPAKPVDNSLEFASRLSEFASVMGLAPLEGLAWQDVARVLIAWWPYLETQGIMRLPPITTVVSAALGDGGEAERIRDTLGRVIKVAVRFLEQSGCPSEVALVIPWRSVPWARVPWDAVAKQFPDDLSYADFWAFYARVRAPLGLSGAEGLQVARSGSVPPPQPFLSLQWADFKRVKWSLVPWESIAWSSFLDGQVAECASTRPGRLRELYACRQCFEGQGYERFAQYLCGQLDPCDCLAGSPQQTPQLPPGGRPPGPEVPNFSCTPFPQCLSEPGNWPASVPQPCTPFPECVPEWLKGEGGKTPGQEPKEEGVHPGWYVAGIGAAVVVAGAIVWAATRPNPQPQTWATTRPTGV